MTRDELTALAETAEERTKGHLRAALADPVVKFAVQRPRIIAQPPANDLVDTTKADKRA